jgi:hypothetical protein
MIILREGTDDSPRDWVASLTLPSELLCTLSGAFGGAQCSIVNTYSRMATVIWATVKGKTCTGRTQRTVIMLSDFEDPTGGLICCEKVEIGIPIFQTRRRPGRLAEAAAILLRHRPPQTPVFVGRNLGPDGEEQHIVALSELAGAELDMLSIVIVGSRTTRRLDADRPLLYTPRGYLDRGPG